MSGIHSRPQVVREGGAISEASVGWRVVADPGNDLVKDSGEVVFSDGQTEGLLQLQVTDDSISELDEILQIVLVNVTEVGWSSIFSREL